MSKCNDSRPSITNQKVAQNSELRGECADDESAIALLERPGFGSFRKNGPLGLQTPLPTFDFAVCYPPSVLKRPGPYGLTPAAMYDAGDVTNAGNAKKKNPPPAAKPGKSDIKILKPPAGIDYAITIETLKDTVSATQDSAGDTGCRWSDWKFDLGGPVYDSTSVVSLARSPNVSAVLSIQTSYNKIGVEKMLSGYGRGTTAADIKSGDVTLGFHESCHRADFAAYFNSQPLPNFEGFVGMPGDAFNQAWADFIEAFKGLPKAIMAWSQKTTDEVGVTQTKWNASHKKKK